MDIPELKTFIAIEREGSFSKAAKLLKVSQPAASRRIQSLEESIGQKLFHREGQSITLTDAGARLLPLALDIIDRVQKARAEMESMSSLVQGPLMLGVSHHFAEHYLAIILAEFTMTYPLVQLKFKFAESEQVLALIESSNVDLGLGTLPYEAVDKIHTDFLVREPLVLAAATTHPMGQASLQGFCDIKQLATTQAILPPNSSFTGQTLQAAFQEAGIVVSKNIECNAFSSLKSLLVAQVGWGLLPHRLLDKRLCELRTTPMIRIHRDLGLLTHKHRTPSQACKAFTTSCQKTLNNSLKIF